MPRGLTDRALTDRAQTDRAPANTPRARRASGVVVALALTSAALAGTAVPAASASGPSAASTSARPAWARSVAATSPTRFGARPQSVATPLSTNRNICWEQGRSDAAGDASTLDIVSAILQYDCASRLLTLSVRTRDSFATPQVHDFFGAFDIDGDGSTGCGGSDMYADAAWVPSRGEMLAAVFSVSSCAAKPTLEQWLTPKRVDRYHISLSFPPATYFPHMNSFNWGVLIAPDPDNFDVLGHGGLTHAGIPNFPPSGSTAFTIHTPTQVGGAFTEMVPGQFAGNNATDVLLYRAGSGADALWWNDGTGHFTSHSLTINGAYTAIIPGDFNHDGDTDLLFYLAGPKQDFIWYGNGAGGFTSHPFTINGSYYIVPGDYNGDAYTDLLFYAPGPGHDYIWTFKSGGYNSRPFTINGKYVIAPADVTGDNRTDLLFYAPGTAADYIWNAHAVGSGVEFGSHAYPINSVYDAVIGGDFDGDAHDDLFFWSRGWGRDAMLRGQGSAPYLAAGSQITINEFYDEVLPGDYNNDGKADLFLVQFGGGADQLWEGK